VALEDALHDPHAEVGVLSLDEPFGDRELHVHHVRSLAADHEVLVLEHHAAAHLLVLHHQQLLDPDRAAVRLVGAARGCRP
jgi:hypothetical protein